MTQLSFQIRYRKVIAAARRVSKSKKADAGKYSYRYADLTSVLDLLDPLLDEQQVTFTQELTWEASPAGGMVTLLTLKILDLESEDQLEVSRLPIPEDKNPQVVGSMLTYYRRYQLMSVFGIAAEDDDAALAAGRATAMRTQATPATPLVAGGIDAQKAAEIWDAARKKQLTKEELMLFCAKKTGRDIARLGQLQTDEAEQILTALSI